MRRFLHFIAGLLGIIGTLAFVEYFPSPRYSYFWDRTYDTGHILVFGIGVMMCLTMIRAFFGERAIRAQYIAACIVAFVLGVLVEVWQSFHERTAELIDVFNDFVGIVAFAAVYAILDKRLGLIRTGWLRRRYLAGFALIVMFVGLLPFFDTLNLYRNKRRIMPSLMDLQQPWYPRFYYERSGNFEVVDPPASWPEAAKHWPKVAKLSFDGRLKYPGFVYREPYPNWTGDYKAFEMDVYFEEPDPREFVFRVHDYAHNNDHDDRFNKVVKLETGFQTLRFELDDIRHCPNGRELDLTRVDGFGFFTFEVADEITLYLGDMRLVKE